VLDDERVLEVSADIFDGLDEHRPLPPRRTALLTRTSDGTRSRLSGDARRVVVAQALRTGVYGFGSVERERSR